MEVPNVESQRIELLKMVWRRGMLPLIIREVKP
jgi:hypothetical protein